jgi:hypothetical protein
MREVWLRANTRLHWALAALALFGLLLLGTLAAIRGWHSFYGVGLAGSGLLLLLCVALLRRPRLGYERGFLLCWLGGLRPVRVPIDVVEGFLLGQGPSYLPGKRAARLDTNTLVIRLAERAAEWERAPTSRRLASWCGHYVTIRGTWCEPLSVDVATRLNQRLYDVTHEKLTSGAA